MKGLPLLLLLLQQALEEAVVLEECGGDIPHHQHRRLWSEAADGCLVRHTDTHQQRLQFLDIVRDGEVSV